MKRMNDTVWAHVAAALQKSCDRVTAEDLSDCEQRIDLVIAKIQNRHWVSRSRAEEIAVVMLQNAEALATQV